MWIHQDKSLQVMVCAIVKVRKGKSSRWEYEEIDCFEGDWCDLAFELHNRYGQFKDRLDFLPSKRAVHDKLDSIGRELEKADMPYEFKLPDRTDDWYVAYCKPAVFRVDADGKLR